MRFIFFLFIINIALFAVDADEFNDEFSEPKKEIFDPLSGYNRAVTGFNDYVFMNIIDPYVFAGYDYVAPLVVRSSVKSFFDNLKFPITFVNNLLQTKFKRAWIDVERFGVNTTFGLFGFFDPATTWLGLPKSNEDFGQTLGYWGIPSGNYLVLPIFGPSSPRDTVGLIGDTLFNPITYVSILGGSVVNGATAGARVLDVTDRRANLMTTEKIVDEGSVDRYDFIRDSYKQNREYLIHDGKSSDDSDPDLNDESSFGDTKANSPTPVTKKASGKSLKLSEPK